MWSRILELSGKAAVLPRRTARKTMSAEALEDRRLMTVNLWKSAVSGDWTTASDWSLGHVPLSTEDVGIEAAGSYTVKHATAAASAVKSLTVMAATLELDAGSITVSGPTTIENSSKLTFKGGVLAKGTLGTTGSGSILTTSSGGALDGVTLNSSIGMAAGSVLGLRDTITFANSAKFSVGTAHVYLQDETTGAISLAGTGTLNLGGGELTADNSHGHSPTVGSGILLDGSGSAAFTAGINNGTIAADVSGKTLTVTGSITNKNTVKATNAGDLTISNPSTFTNTGTIAAAAGTVLISGAFKAGSGTLSVGIGGTGQGSSYGLINVKGALTLGGTFSSADISGFTPSSSATFVALEFTSASGSFASTATGSFSSTFSSTALTLKAPTSTASNGVVLTLSYTQLEIATNSAFTTGVQTINLSSTATNNITLKPGEFFRFGMDAVVTGNPNPVYGDAWDLANRAAGNSAQPANLGAALIFLTLSTTNDASSVVAPVNVAGFSTASLGPPNAPPFSLDTSGDVSGGDVGSLSPLGGGYLPPTATSTSGVEALGAYSKPNTLFTNLQYQVNGTGSTTLSPLVDPAAVSLFADVTLGTVVGGRLTPPTYRDLTFGGTDKIVNAAPIHITVT